MRFALKGIAERWHIRHTRQIAFWGIRIYDREGHSPRNRREPDVAVSSPLLPRQTDPRGFAAAETHHSTSCAY